MKLTEQETAQRKERIIETAFHLFCRHGIDKVTIADIAKNAQVGEATIYRYFTSKPMLVFHTLNILWEEISGEIEKRVDETEGYDQMTGLQQISVQLNSCRQLYEKRADYVLFSYESKLYLFRNQIFLSMEQYDALMKEIKIHCVSALERGKKDGSIPAARSSEDLFYAIWGAVRGYIVKIVIYSALCQEESPWEQRYRILEDGVLSALAAGWER